MASLYSTVMANVSFAGLLGGLVLTPLLYVFFAAFYNLYLHPLRAYPGPKLLAASQLPYTYHVFRGTLANPTYSNLHARYGPIVRIAPNRLSFLSSQAWKDIYAHKGPSGQNEKDYSIFAPTRKGAVKSIILTDDVQHARYRKLMAPAFSNKAMEEQENLVGGYVDLLIGGLRDEVGKTGGEAKAQDMTAWLNWTTFDITGDLTFGEPFECLEKRAYHPWINNMLELLEFGRMLGHIFYGYPFLRPLLPLLARKDVKERIYRHYDLSNERVSKRLEKGVDARPDFMTLILKNQGKGEGLSLKEMEANAAVLIVAGSETSATLLSGAVYLLLKNPRVHNKLATLLREAFEKDEDITMKKCNQQDYLIAVLRESFRLYPPVPSAFDRKIVDPAGQHIAGHWVPQGTYCGVPQFASYRSPSKFKDADSFIPERWLDDTTYGSDERDIVQPFSVGPRDCIGRNLAYLETRLIMAKLIWNFDLSLVDPSQDWINGQRQYALWQKGPLMVNVKPVRK